jgi:alpha-L-rhamnosidase
VQAFFNFCGMKKLKHCLYFILVFNFSVTNTFSQTANKSVPVIKNNNPAVIFNHPPASAKPGVLWIWAGSNITKAGITKDIEALKAQGFGRATMLTLADAVVPWVAQIKGSPTPEIIAFTEPWWKLVRHAAQEAKKVRIDFGMHNCAGYSSSGGTWVTPQLSMQELCWSQKKISSADSAIVLMQPLVPLTTNVPFQDVIDTLTNKVVKPIIAARKSFYKDVAVIAMPDKDSVQINEIVNLTGKMQPNGKLSWVPPAGNWIIYRFGHTTTGTIVSPAQFKAAGLEADKINQQAVNFHIDYIISEIKKHIGDLIGTGFTHVYFDSYEAGTPTFTANMQQEFLKRRGYDMLPYLPAFAGKKITGDKDGVEFIQDAAATIQDLYADIYFKTIAAKLKAAHLEFVCEPYGGPWKRAAAVTQVQTVTTEFWTNNGLYTPAEADETIAAARLANKNIIQAEAFTGMPAESAWTETPAWLKPIGDAAFCAGVNRLLLHRFTHQPWHDEYKPGATMGQWGTHFDRTQTWWKPSKAMIEYWHRCQALLQWGSSVQKNENDFTASTTDSINLQFIHRAAANTHVYFVANIFRKKGKAVCSFNSTGMQPELWDAVTGEMKTITNFINENGKTIFTISFEEAQSFFIVFRKKIFKQTKFTGSNLPAIKTIKIIDGAWQVQFNKQWGGPPMPVLFDSLQDWTVNTTPGIKYFSGTAIYKKLFDVTKINLAAGGNAFYINLGVVKHIAHVNLNGKALGVVWTAPWQIKIPTGLLKNKDNLLQIEITNVWANRLIGDEQQPQDCEWLPGHMGDVIKGYNSGQFLKQFPQWFLNKQPRPSQGRYCFTTWNYFDKNSQLVSSGLLGPVTIITQQ